ncbi:MAG TPA: hypothetical protein DCQ09_16340 [Alcanivorax sp.]|nr:hypothetical protein [Alcanivorax sp.]
MAVNFFVVEEDARELLERYHLDNFDALWSLPHDWVEPINIRKGGWSGVVRVTRDGDTFYVKRQYRQTRRMRSFPWRSRPTYYHEFLALNRLAQAGVPVVQWLLYTERDDAAILVTREPSGFMDLKTLFEMTSGRRLQAAASRLGTALALMHGQRWQHGACYPAHLLIHPETLEVRMLDLERCRRRRSRAAASRADLDQLSRRAGFLPPAALARISDGAPGTARPVPASTF